MVFYKNKYDKGNLEFQCDQKFVLEIIFAIAVIVYPNIGIALAGILIGIALLITSIQIIAAGLSGRSRRKDTLTK